MENRNTPAFPLSRHTVRTHFGGGEGFSDKVNGGYTPMQLRRTYSFDKWLLGEGVKLSVICAFDNEAVIENMEKFCNEFSLPMPKMSVHYPLGKAQNTAREWLIESSLDTQWAHVFAPLSEIFVVFSKSEDVEDMLFCAKFASGELGSDIVAMCFGTEESVSDRKLSLFLENSKSIFVSSSGDVGGKTSFPSTSPFCVSVGGTNLVLSRFGKRISETAWRNGGGGKSEIFDTAFYQGRFFDIYGMTDGKRGTPDVSMMANFNPGVPVFVSQLGGWTTVGGTSLSAACFSGICALMKQKHPDIQNTSQMLSFIYNKAGGDGYEFPQYNFFDITIGKSGDNVAMKGYDFASGLGSPVIKQILL